MKYRFRNCPGCRELTPARNIVCRKCWEKVPADLKAAVKSAKGYDASVTAARRVTAHVTSQPELF